MERESNTPRKVSPGGHATTLFQDRYEAALLDSARLSLVPFLELCMFSARRCKVIYLDLLLIYYMPIHKYDY